MAGGVEGHHGGIRGLVRLLREHGEAVEYDLIALGRNLDELGTKRLSWRDLWVIVRRSPRGSALHWATDPDDAIWSLTNHLLAAVYDHLALSAWARGGSKGPKPKPIPRPGVNSRQTAVIRVGDAMSIDEFERRYAARTWSDN